MRRDEMQTHENELAENWLLLLLLLPGGGGLYKQVWEIIYAAAEISKDYNTSSSLSSSKEKQLFSMRRKRKEDLYARTLCMNEVIYRGKGFSCVRERDRARGGKAGRITFCIERQVQK